MMIKKLVTVTVLSILLGSPTRHALSASVDILNFSPHTLASWKKDFSSGRHSVRFKDARCEKGHWRVDLVNSQALPTDVFYTFWTEDSDGDSLGSTTGSMHLGSKKRDSIDMKISCIDFDFTDIKISVKLI
ncbi:hypothetical protein N9H56_00930 [Pseudomonadales bacterium]|nr:hypothetical protein [Pseudomonadales bacterium]